MPDFIHELATIQTNFVNEVMKWANVHNIDKDEAMEAAVNPLVLMCEVGTFENYEVTE